MVKPGPAAPGALGFLHKLRGDLAGPLAAVQARFADVEIGSYPFFHEGRPGCSVVARSTDASRLEAVGEALSAMMAELGAEAISEPPE